jgi:hypothetical protein
MLNAALGYHNEGLTVIPIKTREKAPALREWEVYQTRQSTEVEIREWWRACPAYNVGIVHGDNGKTKYIAIDIDHDLGALDLLRAVYPALFTGRLEQSGSGAGYHLPLFVDTLPDLGWDRAKNRPRGNRTWHTKHGDVNIRAQWCQTLAPPSVHPSGGLYRFIQTEEITNTPNIDAVIAYLNELDPKARAVQAQRQTTTPPQRENDTLAELKRYWPSIVDAFRCAGLVGDLQQEPGGEVRILKHGGLVVDEREGRWYSFEHELGGDVIDAFGWARFGQAWDRHNRSMFREIVNQMRELAGIGTVRAQFPAAVTGGQRVKSKYFAS